MQLKTKWENEKSEVDRVTKLKEEIDTVNKDIAAAEREYNLEKAAELKYGKLPELQKQLKEYEAAKGDKENELVHESVNDDEIAKIISRWTGIPVSKL